MTRNTETNPADIISVLDLIKIPNLSIPPYQRPYKWSEKNCNELFFDIKEALDAEKSAYRLGNLILHESDSKFNIVDGQQRTISLLLLLKELKTEEIRNAIKIPEPKIVSHGVSINHLNKNRKLFYDLINDCFKDADAKEKYVNYILDKCQFVKMVTTSEYQSFQMFDSQNSRGKELDPRDLLKAYHLRELSPNLSDEEKIKIDKRWISNTDKINALLERVLYPVKAWAKGEAGESPLKNHVDDFKGISRFEKSNGCHNYARPSIYVRNYVDDYNNENQTNISFGVLGKIKYPFQLTGQILNGETFFEMIFHYCDLLEEVTQKLSEFYEQEGIKDIHLTTQNILAKSEQDYYKYSTRLFYNLLLVVVDRFCLETEDFKVIVHKLFKYSLSLRLAYQRLREKTYLNFATGEGKDRFQQNENVCQFILSCKNIKDLMKFNVRLDNEKESRLDTVPDGIKNYLFGEENGQ